MFCLTSQNSKVRTTNAQNLKVKTRSCHPNPKWEGTRLFTQRKRLLVVFDGLRFQKQVGPTTSDVPSATATVTDVPSITVSTESYSFL